MDERKLHTAETESERVQKILLASTRVHATRATEQKSLFNSVAEMFIPTPPTDTFGLAQDAMKMLITKKPPQ